MSRVELQGVHKSFEDFEALRGIDDVALTYSIEHKWGAAIRMSRQQADG